MVRRAMIMAAGVGSRLEPLTLSVPKPLMPIANIPVMDVLFENLERAGIKSVIANTFYLADKIEQRYTKNSPVDIDFTYIREDVLSGTAGGLKKCQHFFDDGEDFFVMSADGLFDIDLKEVIASHKKSNAIATMVLKETEMKEVSKYGVVVCDENNFVKEFQEKPGIEEAKSNLINTGIYIFKYDIFKYIPENEFFDFAKNVFPSLLKANEKINTYKTDGYWSDIGSIEQYTASNHDVFDKKILPEIKITNLKNSRLIMGDKTELGFDVALYGDNIIGNNCTIETGAIIENSIIFDNVKIAKGVVIKDSIIAENAIINIDVNNEIISSNTVLYNKLERV